MPQVYLIKPGDTLAKIASRYGVTVDELLALNIHIDDPDVIYAGQPINVPDSGTSSNSNSNSNTGNGSAPWLPIALGELGEKEIPGPEHNERIVE